MQEMKIQSILDYLTRLPIMDTDQVGRAVCRDNGSPNKRASEFLQELEGRKMVEGRRREMGKAKVWRLSKKGRDLCGVKRPPVPLNSMKVDHLLAIGDALLSLEALGKLPLSRWLTELREPLGKRKYCPDAFFVFNGRPYLLEVQRSPLSSKRWAEKWTVAAAFFSSPDHVKAASFQLWPGKIIKPQIVVVTNQEPDQVKAGSRLPLLIMKSVQDMSRL